MQTILGSGGAIGTELANALTNYTSKIRLVSRNPKKVNTNDEILSADLLKKAELEKAIHGSDIVYITVGFPYSLKVWSNSWVPFIKNAVDICSENNIKMVFFDNVYMYDISEIPNMTEDAKINPPSQKGEIRAEVAKIIQDKIIEGKLDALFARSADFYGPSIKKTSVLTEMLFNPLSQKKKANWLCSVDYKHSFTYTPDAAKATALLGNTESAYKQVWHLPTAKNPLTGKEWIETVATELAAEPKFQVATKFIAKIMGWFNPVMKEIYEMLYQYDRDYIFNSDKFDKTFDFKTTSYLDGIKEIIERDYKP